MMTNEYITHRKKEEQGIQKGFIVTIDALIALILSVFFITYTFGIINAFPERESISHVKLQHLGEDVLNVMEMMNAFGSKSAIDDIFSQTGSQICLRVELYNQSFSPAHKKNVFTKQGCASKRAAEGEERIFRTYYKDGDFNYAVLYVWLKEK
ncbi:MAG: hypothetical protein QW112_01965 [Candidatus Micrarchaeia archaeon]